MYARDTIAALATAVGPAAIAVIRISGGEAEAIAHRVFRGGRSTERWESHRLHLGRIVDAEERTLDRALAVLMRAPASYTGEDVVELHCHGGVTVARSVLGAVLQAGARLAERGEFTARAFFNGKLDLAQAESVADLISARTDRAARVALEHLDGALSRAVEDLRGRIIGIAATLEVAIDFAEEDVPGYDPEALSERSAVLAAELLALAATHESGRLLRDGIKVAIVGKPNVGKSSLLNRLLGTARAIVTPIAGTTRDVIEESIDLEGVVLTLSDTAGIREAADEVERIGVSRTEAEIAAADLVLAVFDHASEWSEEDDRVLAATHQNKAIYLINKIDLPQKLVPCLPAPIQLSVKTGEGMSSVRAALLDAVGSEASDEGGVTVTRERHRAALAAAAEAMNQAAESFAARISPDAIGVDIMLALDHLGEIVGSTSVEDVLDRIFNEFCIGK